MSSVTLKDVRRAVEIIDAEIGMRVKVFASKPQTRQIKVEEMQHVKTILVALQNKMEQHASASDTGF